MDFTLHTYRALLEAFLEGGYHFTAVEDYGRQVTDRKLVILRHDVDRRPSHSFRTACLEKELGIRGTYYFRIVPESFQESIIRRIAQLGHEIGYHYEDLAIARGDAEAALLLFEKNLQRFRRYYEVRSICMHGSPLSAYDNRAMWENRSYTEFGVACEPYFDIDFASVLYLSDTGRSWLGGRHRVRDREMASPKTPLSQQYPLRKTSDIILALKRQSLPSQVMLNFHPQRWTNNAGVWARELVLQSIKNQVKRILFSGKMPPQFSAASESRSNLSNQSKDHSSPYSSKSTTL